MNEAKLFEEKTGPKREVPKHTVEGWLEKNANFYYNANNPQKETPYIMLLREINGHKNKGANWREDAYLLGKVEDFIKGERKRYVLEKEVKGDGDGAAYYKEYFDNLLNDLLKKSEN